MTRFRADMLLLLASVIWGTAFIAQKQGMDGIGPLAFVAVRFSLSFLVVLPLAFREYKKQGSFVRTDLPILGALGVSFAVGVILQQIGMVTTSVTNAGFLTGLYVVFVPFIVWFGMKQKPQKLIWPACFLAIVGIWFLNGASLDNFRIGDWLVLACALAFAFQMIFMGIVVKKSHKPLMVSASQYLACAGFAWIGVFVFENINLSAVVHNMMPVAYAGIVSGGFAFTLQAIAQRYTPSSDAAIIMSSETLFAALAGYLMLNERLEPMGWIGCIMIFAAIILIEAGIYVFKSKK